MSFCLGLSVFSRRLATSLVCLVLAACTARDEFGPAVDVQPTAIPGIALSESGLGLVDDETSFSSGSISSALNGARVETVNATDNGRVVSQLAAFGPSGLQFARFQGSSGGVGEIQVVSEEVPGPNGARVGMTYQQTGGNGMICEEGTGSWTQMAVCKQSGSAITYVYSVPLWREGRMPRGRELNEAVLNRMIWER